MAMMVESDAPLSASEAIPQCLRSWNRKREFAQADRQIAAAPLAGHHEGLAAWGTETSRDNREAESESI